MATPDRTTIRAAIDEFADKLRTNLAADPPTVSKPLRVVDVGISGVEEQPRPFLSLLITGFSPIGVIDNDKVVEVTLSIRVVTDVLETDPHDAMLDTIGAIEDYLDGIVDTGVIDGAEGFDNRAWTLEYPRRPAGARVATATATQTFVVTVERGQNRVPAP